MNVFETNRLEIRPMVTEDYPCFEELLSHPTILELIPQKPFSETEIKEKWNAISKQDAAVLKRVRTIWGIYVKNAPELIGLSLFLTNDEGDRELGYRFRPDYWGQGYGTEFTKGIIEYCFNTLKLEKVTADVNTINMGSVKILEKFMTPVREFFNAHDNCTDRRYELYRKDW